MQIKILLAVSSFLFSLNSFSYECRAKELKLKKTANKKEAFHELRKLNRQVVVEGLLYELTTPEFTKKNAANSAMIENYLENSEVNMNQRSFFKLLATSAGLESAKPKSLKMNEVCEIMERVNGLDGK